MKTLITITGPSLTGKNKLADMLAEHGIKRIVSTTTRPMREGEVDGVHYDFVSKEEFLKHISADEMIEHVKVGGNLYGISKQSIQNAFSQEGCVMSILEPDGALRLGRYCKEKNIPLHQVFLNNPTEVLAQRFLQRYKNDIKAQDEVYAQRIVDMLTKEPKEWIEPAYASNSPYHQVFDAFNDQNQKEVMHAILDAIHNRAGLEKSNDFTLKKYGKPGKCN